MSALIGKWVCCPKLMTGFEEFQTAQGATPEEKELWRNLAFTLDISRDGDNWRQVMDAGDFPGGKVAHVFKSGETFEFKSLNGKKNMRSITTVTDDRIIERMGIQHGKGAFKEWDKITERDGEMLKMTHSLDGAQQIMIMKRIDECK